MTGFRVPLCRCGHPAGDHKSAGNPVGPRRYGFCFREGCDCREYIETTPRAKQDEALRELRSTLARMQDRCEFCGRFYSKRTAKDHAWCLQEYDRQCAERAGAFDL